MVEVMSSSPPFPRGHSEKLIFLCGELRELFSFNVSTKKPILKVLQYWYVVSQYEFSWSHFVNLISKDI